MRKHWTLLPDDGSIVKNGRMDIKRRAGDIRIGEMRILDGVVVLG